MVKNEAAKNALLQDWTKVPRPPNGKISTQNLLTEQQCAIVNCTL